MPNILGLIPPVGYRVVKCFRRLNLYADHPESFPLDLRYRHTHELAFSLVAPFHIRFIFKGLENAGNKRAVFFFNHQSDFDPPATMMFMKRPGGYLAKKKICTYPIIDQIVRATDGNYLDRKDLRQEVRTIRDIGNKLTNDPEMNFIVFPEGQRSQDPINRTMKPFKPGSFKSAYYAKADIVPCCLYGTYALLEFNKPTKGVYPLQFTFLPCIKYEDYKDLSTVQLAQKVQAEVEEELERMRKLQPQLEAYWNTPEHIKEYKAECKARMKKYYALRSKERKADKKLAEQSLKEHPKNKQKYRPVVYTEQDRKNDIEAKKERAAEKAEFIRQAHERGEI